MLGSSAALLSGAFALVFGLNGPSANAATEAVIYSFCGKGGCTSGNQPKANLINVADKLYGTTSENGASGGGTAFSIDLKTGRERLLYSFCSAANCADGFGPAGGLINVNGTLYGVTAQGGAGTCEGWSGCGVVFSLDPKTGAETVVHSFNEDGSDGWQPQSGLVSANGTLYGTTSYGGAYGYGTVFSLDPNTGSEQVLHSFNGNDGADPLAASLIDVNGTLYGTTFEGGANTTSCRGGCGTVFAIDIASGNETTLYSFCSLANCTDGYFPVGALTVLSGTLYGTATSGGVYGDGTIYSIDPGTGSETVLHAFSGPGEDGSSPNGSLIKVKNRLYGTTWQGGAGDCHAAVLLGCGTVFSFDPATGKEKVVYSFTTGSGADGMNPAAGLLDLKGVLYGTTEVGGIHRLGGTVFAISP